MCRKVWEILFLAAGKCLLSIESAILNHENFAVYQQIDALMMKSLYVSLQIAHEAP